MDPWNILGWIVLGLFVGYTLFLVLGHLAGYLLKLLEWRDYRKTRNVKPEPGQVWLQNDARLYIEKNDYNDRIVIRSGGASWSDSPEEWERRVRNRKLRLIKDA